MATTTNFGFETPDDTDLVKDGALSIRTALDDVDARFGNVATYPNQIVNVVSGVSRPLPFAISSGQVSINNYAAVTFPASRFTQAPKVLLTAVEPGTLAAPAIFELVSVTTSVANLHCTTATHGANIGDVVWLAIQMTSASASG
jgi:hypothetical protein